MSVTTGSIGTADIPASSPSLHGLDGVNFFLAAILAGFGPYVAAYLADAEMDASRYRFRLSLQAASPACSAKLPGGELLDKVRSKRAVIAVGAGIVILSALSLAFWPRLPLVFIATSAAGHDWRVSWAGDRCDQSWLGWSLGAGRTTWA